MSPAFPPGIHTILPEGVPGTATVILKLAIDSVGKLADLSILKSSGDADIDRAAFYAAAHSVYKPRQFLCAPVPGYYSFRANFNT